MDIRAKVDQVISEELAVAERVQEERQAFRTSWNERRKVVRQALRDADEALGARHDLDWWGNRARPENGGEVFWVAPRDGLEYSLSFEPDEHALRVVCEVTGVELDAEPYALEKLTREAVGEKIADFIRAIFADMARLRDDPEAPVTRRLS